MKNLSYFIGVLFVSCAFLTSCARIGSPEGGPIDKESPVCIKSDPANYSKSFKGKKIKIDFDEFVKLNDLTKEFVVSPPFDVDAEIISLGKRIDVTIASKLKENTTYNLNFGNSIADNNENNVLKSFQYVFSTGSYIDSLSFRGNIMDAYTMHPLKERCFAVLYSDYALDSFKTKKPSFIAATDEKGDFLFSNLPYDTFRLYALCDENKNLFFDLSTELIAFSDTLILLNEKYYIQILKADTISFSDSTYKKLSLIAQDSIKSRADSIENAKFMQYFPNVNLLLFEEENKVYNQYVKDYERVDARRLRVYMNRPMRDTLKLTPLDSFGMIDWNLTIANKTVDSFNIWLKDTSLIRKEKLQILFTYESIDTNNADYIRTDTLSFFYKPKPTRKKQVIDTLPREILKYNTSVKSGGRIDLNSVFKIESNTPIASVDTSKIKLFKIIDTLLFPLNYRLSMFAATLKDSINNSRSFNVVFPIIESMKYEIQILPEAITDIYTVTNDSLEVSFSANAEDMYGKIIVELKNVSGQLGVQLLSPSGNTIAEKSISTSSKINFNYLYAGEYQMRIIFDDNNNGKWDTGDLILQKQAEKVLYFDQAAKVKSGWDTELEWTIPK